MPKFLEELCYYTGHGKKAKDERETFVAERFWNWHDGGRENPQARE